MLLSAIFLFNSSFYNVVGCFIASAFCASSPRAFNLSMYLPIIWGVTSSLSFFAWLRPAFVSLLSRPVVPLRIYSAEAIWRPYWFVSLRSASFSTCWLNWLLRLWSLIAHRSVYILRFSIDCSLYYLINCWAYSVSDPNFFTTDLKASDSESPLLFSSRRSFLNYFSAALSVSASCFPNSSIFL